MDIPRELQDKLKCSVCNEFLSCGPIYLLHRTGGTICGRCSQQPQLSERSRLSPYEATASLLAFPCVFADQGCPIKVPFSLGCPPHESSCEFRPFICPIEQCDWRGPWPKLKQHCAQAHPSNILENPCSLPQPDLTATNCQSYLIPAFNFLFLLQLKVCTISEKMFHSVRMYGDVAFLSKFSFKLNVKGNNMQFVRSGAVLRADVHTISEPTIVCTAINCLLGVFGANESKVTLRIQALFKYCANCFCEIEEESRFCRGCTEKLTKCRFHEKGCLFVDIHKKKCLKHERLFCEYQTKCECAVDFAGGTLTDHLESSSSCQKTSKSILGADFRLRRNIDANIKVILFASKHFATVICEYKLADNRLLFRVFTAHASHDLNDLKCSIRLIDPVTKHTRHLTPRTLAENSWWDWLILEEMNGFASWREHGTDVKLVIERF